MGLIPARVGSKGIPGKNLKALGGKPLIQYSIESALQSSGLDAILVSTDSPDIQNFARTFCHVNCPFLRPARLADDHAAMIEVVRHALDYCQTSGHRFDYVMLLQPTSPFRQHGLIDRAIRQIMDEKADSLISVRSIPQPFNPYWAFQFKEAFLEPAIHHPLISRRQDLPETYHRDGEIYIARTSLVREGSIIGGKTAALIQQNAVHVNLDTEADWVQAEQMIAKWNTEKENCL